MEDTDLLSAENEFQFELSSHEINIKKAAAKVAYTMFICAKAHYFCRPSTCQLDSLYQNGRSWGEGGRLQRTRSIKTGAELLRL